MLLTVKEGKLVKLFETVHTDSEGCQLHDLDDDMPSEEELLRIEQVSYNDLYWLAIYEWTGNTFKENSMEYKNYLMQFYNNHYVLLDDKEYSKDLVERLLKESEYFKHFHDTYLK